MNTIVEYEMSDTEIYLLALLIGSLWLKVILLFGLNRLVGPLIRTVASMISDRKSVV